MLARDADAAAVRLPPPLLYLGVVIVGVVVDALVTPWPLPIGDAARIGLAASVLLTALALIGSAAGLFKRTGQDPKPWKTTPRIVSTGIYRMTRNPMYLGMALLQAAIGVGLANVWILALLPASMVGVYATAIRHEEAYLEGKFGDPYRAYKASVRRWMQGGA